MTFIESAVKAEVEDFPEQKELLPESAPEPISRGIKVPLASLEDFPDCVVDASFARSVKAYGIMVPIIIAQRFKAKGKGVQKGEFTLEVIDGRRRVTAAKKAALIEIPADIYDAADLDNSSAVTLLANNQRSRNYAAELAAIEDLMSRGFMLKEIARGTGLPVGSVNRLLSLRALIAPIRNLFDNCKLAASVCFSIAKLPDSEQQKLFEIYEQTKHITAKDVHDVQQVRREEAVDSLPDDMFPEDAVEPESWRSKTLGAIDTLNIVAAGFGVDISPYVANIMALIENASA